MIISRLHYLTQDMESVSHAELAEAACQQGIRWVQLRVKNQPKEAWKRIALDVKTVCDRYTATLIINDNVQLALELNAHGVHLGKEDMPVKEARAILGPDKIIGGTANTLQDILQLQEAGADYIGLGPFRFTATKAKLAPVLGLEGYQNILQSGQVQLPLIAIGGIQPEDVPDLVEAGVYGVAVASVINTAADKAAVIQHLLRSLHQ